jgi:hypothetical protein
MHTSIFHIVLYNSCTIATPKHQRLFLIRNKVYIFTFKPNLPKASFYSIIEFLYYNATTKLILLLELIKGKYLTLKVL